MPRVVPSQVVSFIDQIFPWAQDQDRARQAQLTDFMAEVFAVIHLSRIGYTAFEGVVTAGANAAVDYTARHNDKRVRIEVKRLHEPQDIIRTVVANRWKELVAKEPDRHDFRLAVEHSYHGSLSRAAVARLKNAVDQIASVRDDEYRVTLDGAIRVTLRRVREPVRTGLVIQSSLGPEDFRFDLAESQKLLIKAYRVVSESLAKFFGARVS